MNPQQDVVRAWMRHEKKPNKASNLFFVGNSLYSFGLHFVLARHLGGAVLVNDSRYSSTTDRHRWVVMRAAFAAHRAVFRVGKWVSVDPGMEHIQYYQTRFNEAIAKARRSIKYSLCHLDRASSIAREASDFIGRYHLEIAPIAMPQDWNSLRERAQEQLFGGVIFCRKLRREWRLAPDTPVEILSRIRKREEPMLREMLLVQVREQQKKPKDDNENKHYPGQARQVSVPASPVST